MTAARKLVVWDHAWAPYASHFTAHLGSGWDVVANGGDVDWLRQQIAGATALVAVRMPPEVLADARDLSLFLFPGAGVLITDPAAYPAGCLVVNVYEHETPIAEYVLMMMLLETTRLLGYRDTFRAGRWDGSGRVGGTPHSELSGRTVGIFGYGRIGQAIAIRARAFGMRIAALTRGATAEYAVPPDVWGGPEQLPALLRETDFLVIAAPLTPETKGRIGAAELQLLPRHATLINVSRAEIVDEQALYDALEGGRLGGAALDVWYQYPPPGETGYGSRLPFHTLPNVICTPHYSAWSKAMIMRRIGRMCESLGRLSRGEELERVVLTGTWRP